LSSSALQVATPAFLLLLQPYEMSISSYLIATQ